MIPTFLHLCVLGGIAVVTEHREKDSVRDDGVPSGRLPRLNSWPCLPYGILEMRVHPGPGYARFSLHVPRSPNTAKRQNLVRVVCVSSRLPQPPGTARGHTFVSNLRPRHVFFTLDATKTHKPPQRPYDNSARHDFVSPPARPQHDRKAHTHAHSRFVFVSLPRHPPTFGTTNGDTC